MNLLPIEYELRAKIERRDAEIAELRARAEAAEAQVAQLKTALHMERQASETFKSLGLEAEAQVARVTARHGKIVEAAKALVVWEDDRYFEPAAPTKPLAAIIDGLRAILAEETETP